MGAVDTNKTHSKVVVIMINKTIRSRNEFPSLLRALGLVGYAAEVGVAEGYFSFHLLDNWPGYVCMIDPWRRLDVPGYSVHGDEDQVARYKRIIARAGKYKGRAIVHRATSVQAAVRYEDGCMDFIYIDANHTLAAATEDIGLWWPKVKSGGILAGHDFLDGVYHGEEYGVKTAVLEFSAKNGTLPVHVTLEHDWPSWYVFKP